MHKAFIRTLMATLAVVMAAGPAMAQSVYTTNFDKGLKVSNGLTVSGVITQTGNPTITGNPAITGNVAVTGNATVSGTLGVTGATSLTVPLTAANINGANKVKLLRIALSPNTGACADSTVYRGMVFPGRICTVKKITLGCQTPPSVGTDVIKVLKASSAGNTLLSTATYDANSLTANTGTAMTLTATGADLALTATQGIYAEYSAGTQTVDGIGIEAEIEIELTDY